MLRNIGNLFVKCIDRGPSQFGETPAKVVNWVIDPFRWYFCEKDVVREREF